MEKKEEEYDIKYTDYCINVTTNDGRDGTALIQEYHQCKYQWENLNKLKKTNKNKKKKKKMKKRKEEKPSTRNQGNQKETCFTT